MAGFYCDIERAHPVGRDGRTRLPVAPVTWSLVLVNVAAFAIDHFNRGLVADGLLEGWAELHFLAVWQGEWWRIVTSCFVHADGEHLLYNMIPLVVFGHATEPAMGKRRFLFAYLLSGAAASLASLALHPGISLGASAAVMGIAGSYCALLWRAPRAWWRWSVLGWRWLWTLFAAFPLLSTLGAEGIDHIAHLAGLATGLWYGAALPVRRWAPRPAVRRLRRRRAALAAAVGVIAAVAATSFWVPGWWLARAAGSAGHGDWSGARRDLYALEACANPGLRVDAATMVYAAEFCLQHGDSLRARSLLERCCPTLHAARLYRKLADLQAYVPPYHERRALENYRLALAVDADFLPALADLAWLQLTAEDSTVFDPAAALALAEEVVRRSSRLEAAYLYLLAEALHRNDRSEEAFRCMREALVLEPRSRDYYMSEMTRMQRELLSDRTPKSRRS